MRDDPPGRERHLDRVLGLRDRPGQEDEAHYRLPCQHGPQFRGILRVRDSLQFTAGHSVATPLNWHEGRGRHHVTATSEKDAKEKFPKGFRAVKPHPRFTPQPNR